MVSVPLKCLRKPWWNDHVDENYESPATIRDLIENNGGVWSGRLSDGATHVLATISELTHMSDRGKAIHSMR